MKQLRLIVERLGANHSYSHIRQETGASKGLISKIAAVVRLANKTPACCEAK